MVLSNTEKEKISKSIEAVIQRLEWYFTDVEEENVFGSYSRATILPRKADENSDVDLMVVFSNEYGYKPQSFLNRLKAFAEYYYSTSEIFQSSPTIVLELNHIKFELVPAYEYYGALYIPDGPSNWMFTDPFGFSELLKKCNGYNHYMIKPVIRLMKLWNIHCNYRDLKSYKLEQLLADKLMFAYITCDSYSDYILRAFKEIKYYTNLNRVDSAIEHIEKALKYEKEKMPYTALSEIKKVFPEV